MDSVATEHAHAVGREAVSAGLVSQADVADLFPVYEEFLRKGAKGTFTQLMLSRGLINEEGFQALETRVPARGARASGRFSLPKMALDSTLQFEDVLEATPPAPEPLVSPHPPAPPPLAPGGSGTNLPAATGWGSGTRLPASPRPQPPSGSHARLPAAPQPPASPPPAPAAAPSDGLAMSLDSSRLEGSRAPDSTVDGSRGEEEPAGLDLAPLDDDAAREEAFFNDSDEDNTPIETPQHEEPQIGEVLGDYELLEILGRGGMGVIFKAKKKGSDQPYALKTLLAKGSKKSKKKARERFRREVEALRRLDHPGIVKVHTCGKKGPWDWYVMDFIQGRELKELMRDWDRPVFEQLQLFEDVCKAVQHAHERFVVHRDLKPANILITDEGQVIVLDFGLAKLFDEEMSLTKTGATLGTPYYMAPEQLLNPKGVDSRADVYALGALFYEMMTGRPPFMGDTFGVISNKIMNEDPPPPSTVKPGLHPSLDMICLKALEKDPARRHRDAEALRLAVATYRRGTRKNDATDKLLDDGRRWMEKNATGFMVGVVVSSLIYWPLLFFVYTFL